MFNPTSPPAGSPDAFLTPYYVDRAKIYIKERFAGDEYLDTDVVCANIERTRFPVSSEEDHKAGADLPGLLRAADLIGELADPQYFSKISLLFTEFKETDQAAKMGYTNAADLQAGCPKFFWTLVSPYISKGSRYLRKTQEGQTWVANLYANVFTEYMPMYSLKNMKHQLTDQNDATVMIDGLKQKTCSRPLKYPTTTNVQIPAEYQISFQLTALAGRSAKYGKRLALGP